MALPRSAFSTASAASLGGLTSSSLGADQTVIASCDTDGISMTYTNTYDATTNAYKVNGVVTAGVNAACTGKTFKLTLSDGTVSLGEFTGSITGASQTVTVSPVVDAKSDHQGGPRHHRLSVRLTAGVVLAKDVNP